MADLLISRFRDVLTDSATHLPHSKRVEIDFSDRGGTALTDKDIDEIITVKTNPTRFE